MSRAPAPAAADASKCARGSDTAGPLSILEKRLYVLPGFDPRGAAPLHALLKQAYPLGERSRQSSPGLPMGALSRWPLESSGAEGGGASEEIVALHWSDIARRHWPRQPLQLLADGLPMACWYLLGGGILKVSRLAPAAAFTGIVPVVVVAMMAATALVAALILQPLGALMQLMAVGLVLAGGWQLAEHLGVLWLFRTLRFTHQLASGRVPELQQRVGAWADQILALEHACPAGELVLAGHSCGTFVAVMLAAELRRRPAAAAVLQRLNLLTLGHNIPHLALLPAAQGFRCDLAQLQQQPRLPWRDWSSSDDWLCFAGVNPLVAAGLAAASSPYPQQRLLPLGADRGIAGGWRGFWGRFTHQYPLHFDYLHWLPLRRRSP